MSSNPRKRKIDEEGRVFNESWTFDYFVISHADSALCLICHESIKTLKTFNIKRHYESRHKNYFSLQGDVRSNKITSLKKSVSAQQNIFKSKASEIESCVRASYQVTKYLCEKGKPLTDGEFVKECMLKTVKEICPEKLSLFQNVSLSASTVTRRMEDLSGEVFSTLSEKAHSFQYFSLALDESIDVLDTAQLLIFIRGVDKNFQIVEDLCALRSMKDTTTSENLFLEVHQAVNNLDLSWARLKSVTTDGARNMVGSKAGLVEKICNEVANANGTPPLKFHCIIHQQVLCSKILKFEDIMNVVVSTVNFIRRHGLNHRQFQTFLSEIDSEYGDVLYHTEVRWLSKGKVLRRFFALRHEIEIFLTEKGKIQEAFSDSDWVFCLAFLSDITDHLNNLNLRLQGNGKLVSDMFTEVKSFENKLDIFMKQFSDENFIHFPCCKVAE